VKAIVGVALAVGMAAGPASAASFTVDPSRSSLILEVFKDGLAARLGHDHVVRAGQFSGTISYDAADPDASAIQVEVVTAALVADDQPTRRRFGLTGEMAAADAAEIDRAMKSERQLDVARFPSIAFKSTAVRKQADGRVLVTGRLTIRGVTAEVEFPAVVTVEGGRLRGRAELTFKQSAFGYRPYSALLGAIKNRDEVRLHVDLVARP
jgi:polyisoprenoid-binding protein YceI